MQKKYTFISGTILSAMSSIAAAHGGHDHSHWLSEPIHLLSIAAIAAIVASASYLYKRRSTTKNNKL